MVGVAVYNALLKSAYDQPHDLYQFSIADRWRAAPRSDSQSYARSGCRSADWVRARPFGVTSECGHPGSASELVHGHPKYRAAIDRATPLRRDWTSGRPAARIPLALAEVPARKARRGACA